MPEIQFEWTRAFGKSPSHAAYDYHGGKIRQIGRGKQKYSPLATEALYLKFAQLDGSPAACVGFAESCGLLEHQASSTNPPSEDLSFWRAEIRRMKVLILALPKVVKVVNSRGTFATVGSVDILLVPGVGSNAKPVMVFEPRNLLQAMNLQMAQSITGGNTVLTCQQCGTWFEVGADAKRAVAKFCSDKCRFRFNYERRAGK